MVHKIIPCPHCGKMTIEIEEVPDTILVKRGFTGKKGRQLFRGKDIILTNKCTNCGKGYYDKIEIDYNKRAEDFKRQGLPTSIELDEHENG